ncbi:MAG: inorganic phosphate transporter [Burkholderiaceae bacterium]
MFAAALLSFAHGANDVANAVGPLAGIVDVLTATGEGAGKVAIPMWVMVIGAIGISVGLALFGPKLIRTVGSEITELDRSRAFCISLAAAVTVIVASQLGLPISSTHVAIGAVFGVGFLREFLEKRTDRIVDQMLADHEGASNYAEVESFLRGFQHSPLEVRQRMLKDVKANGAFGVILPGERKRLRKAVRRQLVKRQALVKIVSAWLITVPLSALLSAMFYYLLRGMLLSA